MSEDKQPLLIVEDDEGLAKQMRWTFDKYKTLGATDKASALAILRRFEPAVITLDLGLPPDANGAEEGLATLEEILTLAPDVKVIVVTGNHDRANAVKAVGMGAYDFCQKPFEPEVLSLIIDRAFRLHALQQENRRLRDPGESRLRGILTRDPTMLRLSQSVEKVAPSSATVLLLGESGTGKELFARAIHELSPRATKRFVAINCAAIPENLLESELFGYEKGAFTGAHKQTPGKIELADGGTFFLDEIGDLSPPLQAKLLRFLQERVVERLGGRQEIAVDVRIVCATHQNLKTLIEGQRFREDLYYRLSEIELKIPPLRDRQGDPLLLAHAFMHKFSREQGRPIDGFKQAAVDAIESHGWPGNVRELENSIKRAVIMAEGKQIDQADLGFEGAAARPEPLNLRQVREEAERNLIIKVLGRANGNIVTAAGLLGISRPTLYDLINRYGLKPPNAVQPDKQ